MLLASVVSGEARSRRVRIHLLTAILLCLFAGMTAAERQPLAQEQPQKPNVLFILTDDQAPEDLANMANVQSLLVNQGISFTNAFATNPVCCPSRVSFMRGQYAHNHGVLTNVAGTGGYSKFKELGLQDSTIATWLNDAGYSTFYAGKFLNGYGGGDTYVPPGWDEWYAFENADSVHEDYTVNENGVLTTYTQDQQHETYYLRDRAKAFVRDHAQEGAPPWFAWVSTHAPHGPYTIAPEFQGSYDGVEMPRPLSYNEADVSDKPAWIQAQPLLDDDCSIDKGNLDCHEQVVEKWRARQESLKSVDVMVRDLIGALAETNQLERTYVVFASDNGYMLYRHRAHAKSVPYEESQGIPLVVRGPGVVRDPEEQLRDTSEKLVANIDLAPTIAEWAGIEAPSYVDGRSLAPLLEGSPTPSWRQQLLFESWVERDAYRTPYGGARTAEGETYVEYESGEKEYYDLRTDPLQLDSTHSTQENAERLGALSETLAGLRSCEGAGCRAADRDCSADQVDNDSDGVVDEPGEPCGDTRPLDTTVDAPTITSPAEGRRVNSGSFTVSGTAEAGTTVKLFEGTVSRGTAAYSSSGNWSVALSGVSEGSHSYTAKATDRMGYTSGASSARTVIVDMTAPMVTSVSPVAGATGVLPSTNVSASFSEAMDEASVEKTSSTTGNPTTFTLAMQTTTGTTAPIPAKVAYVQTATSQKAILDPTSDLRLGATYVAKVTSVAKDQAGNRLDQDRLVSGTQSKVWRFKVKS